MKPYVVTFAGVPGTSKSIISQALSCEFRLPIFANDVVRSEVKEDLLADDITQQPALGEFEKRASERKAELFKRGESFILDNSVDRKWDEIKQQIVAAGFDYFLINMELSYEFVDNLYAQTGREKARKQLRAFYMDQHRSFMQQHAADVSLTITDETFAKRIQLACAALDRFTASAA